MSHSRLACAAIAALNLMALCAGAVADAASASPAAGLPRPALVPADPEAAQAALDWLQHRVEHDPQDIMALNMLGNRYLQRMRETGNATYAQLAERAARASLASVPVENNLGALNVLTQVEFATHDFSAARDHAQFLAQRNPQQAYPYQILGDALLELGDYDQAVGIFHRMEESDNSEPLTRVGTEQRLARFDALHGDWQAARRRMVVALRLALSRPNPPREIVAWSWWQLGEIAFAVGDYAQAEEHDRAALITYPGYYRAVASLGRVRAARGDLPGAIRQYEAAVRLLPDPTFIAALGDLYTIAKRPADAARQYQLVESIAHLGAAGGSIYDRQLALFYADHDLKPELAYAMAKREYVRRRDIYGADALAWTALKAGHLAEAQGAIREALRLNTHDAKLFYHSAMIARAGADRSAARSDLERAMALSPRFDPLQAANARTIQLQEFSSQHRTTLERATPIRDEGAATNANMARR